MTQGPRPNITAIEAAVQRNLESLSYPGIKAEREVRSRSAEGTVVADSIKITQGSYKASVEVRGLYGQVSTLLNVQFSVPVKSGDVVKVEIPQGNPLAGIIGQPVRPLGPNVVYFYGPHTISQWSEDTSAPTSRRAANSAFQSYVIPVDTGSHARVHTPLTYVTNVQNTQREATITESFVVKTTPAAVYVEVFADFHGGLKIVGGIDAGSYAVRYPNGRIGIDAYVSEDGDEVNFIYTFTNTHYGMEATGISASPVDRTFDGNGYVDMAVNDHPLIANGGRILFDRLFALTPGAIGGAYTISLFTSNPLYSDLQYFINDSWTNIPAPASDEDYYIWLGLSNVRINVVELGTGSG